MTDRLPVDLDRYGDPVYAPPLWRRAVRKAAPVGAVLLGLSVLVGCAWRVADVVWSNGDPAPVVLPNTVRPSTPAAYPFGRGRFVEKAPVPSKQRSAACEVGP